ncbi:peptidase S24/S26A/S26B/S26C [Dichomitus squalens]|nr:peptidase S24/S26A/S26B/S26C [Dichomitus squalens]
MAARSWIAEAWRSLRRVVKSRQFWCSDLPYRSLQVANIGCILHLFGDHIATISHVAGPSMLPTMAIEGELALDWKWIDVNRLSRGDLVTFISPLDPGRTVCKRITGLPGDVVCVDPTGLAAPSTEHVVVPKNHIWVTGDNLAYSRDSRVYGPVPLGLVKGRLIAKVWPLSKFGVFPNTFDFIS